MQDPIEECFPMVNHEGAVEHKFALMTAAQKFTFQAGPKNILR